jgi:hypothetical protein
VYANLIPWRPNTIKLFALSDFTRMLSVSFLSKGNNVEGEMFETVIFLLFYILILITFFNLIECSDIKIKTVLFLKYSCFYFSLG